MRVFTVLYCEDHNHVHIFIRNSKYNPFHISIQDYACAQPRPAASGAEEHNFYLLPCRTHYRFNAKEDTKIIVANANL